MSKKTSNISDLIQLIIAGETQEALDLIKNGGIDLNVKNNNSDTALLWTAREGNSDVAKVLIDKGADINVKNNNGYTALLWTAREGNSDVAKALIDKGADVNAKNNDGDKALDILESKKSELSAEQYNKKHDILSQKPSENGNEGNNRT